MLTVQATFGGDFITEELNNDRLRLTFFVGRKVQVEFKMSNESACELVVGILDVLQAALYPNALEALKVLQGEPRQPPSPSEN